MVLSALARKYHAIGPLLIKMEGLVVYTNSGKSPRLKAYYFHWEKKIFDAIIRMVNSNLANLAYRMLGSSVPLFTVETLLSAPEVVLHPPANELCKLMTQAMREVVEG